VALVSSLPLKSHWRIPAFVRYSVQIAKQLNSAPGLLGYSLLARVLAKRFWTLSVWENDEALREFVEKAPHVKVMASIAPHVGETKFERWKVKGSEVPLKWEDALRRIEEISK
jgi:heme-degrading monooxygenase HmoA